MSGVNTFQIRYGLGQQTKPRWKTQTVSGGIGAGLKNLGKSNRITSGNDAARIRESENCYGQCLTSHDLPGYDSDDCECKNQCGQPPCGF